MKGRRRKHVAPEHSMCTHVPLTLAAPLSVYNGEIGSVGDGSGKGKMAARERGMGRGGGVSCPAAPAVESSA